MSFGGGGGDRVALVGVQESYRDVLKEALLDERALRERVEEEARAASEEVARLKEALAAMEEELARVRALADQSEEFRLQSEEAAEARRSMLEQCSLVKLEAARTAEKARDRVKGAAELENGLNLQMLALKERLVSSQASAARDRTQLSKTISQLQADVHRRDADVLRAEQALERQRQETDGRVQQAVAETLQQIEPYKQLNAKLMGQLGIQRAEARELAEYNHSMAARVEELEAAAERLDEENTRLKEAQRMLHAGMRTRPLQQPQPLPLQRSVQQQQPPPPTLSQQQQQQQPQQQQQQPQPPPAPDTTDAQAEDQLELLHQQLQQLNTESFAPWPPSPPASQGGGGSGGGHHEAALYEAASAEDAEAAQGPQTALQAFAAAPAPTTPVEQMLPHRGSPFLAAAANPLPEVEKTAGAAAAEVEANRNQHQHQQHQQHQQPQPHGDEGGGGGEDQAEALDALKSSLSEVRGLLAKRARRRQGE
eukprot:Rhum_TRINITY_DN12806_c0_g1::Rhum_TRINITY_DN12806_c0_g1_i1::g.54604::m.54604